MKSRTRRNYSGTQTPLKKMGDMLPAVLLELNQKSKLSKFEVFRFWESLMGEKMASLTEPVSLKEGVLTVKVKSSTLYSLLAVHEKPRLLRSLQEKFSIRDLVFRVG